MKILKTTTEVITRRVTEIDLEDGTGAVVIDHIDSNGMVTDTVYRDAESGYELESFEDLENIEAFMNEQSDDDGQLKV